ncbi:MAG: helix-turn-helix transcriptional regulator [Dehalococcoidales bacterium]|nr:helix-turn-helix transcriptional regulator [Dehalococcoidales bacterium]
MSRKSKPTRTEEEKQYLKQLGENIRKIRQERGYSQEEFAELAGFSRSYYTEVETGKRNISVLNLIKILQVLKTDPSTIIQSAQK